MAYKREIRVFAKSSMQSKLLIGTMRIRIYLLLSILSIASCKREDKVWETNYLAPIFTANLTLEDMLKDSVLYTKSDNSYHLLYKYSIEIDSVGNYLTVPDTVDTVNVKLQSLILEDRGFTDTFTLREMEPQSALFDGLTVPLDAYDIKDAGGSQEIDVSEQFFQTATLNSGYLDVTLHNDLPVYVELIIFTLTNKKDGKLLVNDTFVDIAPFSSKSKSIDLSGKTLDGILVGAVKRVKTRASSGPVLVDADKGVRVELTVRDLKPVNATAIFPAQTLVSENQEVIYKFGGPQITVIRARSGFVKMKIFSTIEEEIVIDYSFPHSAENGDYSKPFKRQYNVPPAKPGETQRIEVSFPLDGFELQYGGKDPKQAPFVNAVYSELTARTVYSGLVRNLSLDDSVYIEFGLVDIVPEFAFGDFGSKTYHLTDPVDVPALKNVTGNIDLKDVSMRVEFENGFGIEALTTVNSLTAKNSRNGKSVALSHAGFVGPDILIGKAINPPFIPRKRTYYFDKSTSNIEEFLEVLPDQIVPDIDILTRPFGAKDYTDFVFYESFLKTNLILDMPVSFAADNLTFVQKKDFSFADINNSQKIKSGSFKLEVQNDFPLSLQLQMEFLDEADQVLHTLFTKNNTVEAAQLDAVLDRTTGAMTSIISADVNPVEMDMIRDSKKVRIRAVFDTPSGVQTNFYSDYQLKTKLIADFTYENSL
ncbi:MAG: hypothetical protein ACI8ZN_000375 [Bacteroidia bacterium]|jgi:hypothetical protein